MVAESGHKNDPLLFVRFWQLEMPHARVLDRTIRILEASNFSSMMHSCDLGLVFFFHSVKFGKRYHFLGGFLYVEVKLFNCGTGTIMSV